tara:strand:+ start:60 stop:290 length:231 start_codon:yes stop_codon:yes gene_type:complete
MKQAIAAFIRDLGRAILSVASKVRPNILAAMTIVGVLGLGIARIGLEMDNGELVSAAGVGAIVAVANLAGKILEKE